MKMDILMLTRENGNCSFYLDYETISEDELLLTGPDSPCKIKSTGVWDKLNSGVGGNRALPAIYSCVHGPVTPETFFKYSVPVSIIKDSAV